MNGTFISPCNAELWARAIEIAWDSIGCGYNLDQERQGVIKMEIARRECGLAFIKVLRSAIE